MLLPPTSYLIYLSRFKESGLFLSFFLRKDFPCSQGIFTKRHVYKLSSRQLPTVHYCSAHHGSSLLKTTKCLINSGPGSGANSIVTSQTGKTVHRHTTTVYAQIHVPSHLWHCVTRPGQPATTRAWKPPQLLPAPSLRGGTKPRHWKWHFIASTLSYQRSSDPTGSSTITTWWNPYGPMQFPPQPPPQVKFPGRATAHMPSRGLAGQRLGWQTGPPMRCCSMSWTPFILAGVLKIDANGPQSRGQAGEKSSSKQH